MANLKPHPQSLHPVAKRLGVHVGTLVRLADRGVLPQDLIFQTSNGRWRIRDASAEQEIKIRLEMWKSYRRKPRASQSSERQDELESYVFGLISPPEDELLKLARQNRLASQPIRDKSKNLWKRLKQTDTNRAKAKRRKTLWAHDVLKYVDLNDRKTELLEKYDRLRAAVIEGAPPHPSLHPLRKKLQTAIDQIRRQLGRDEAKIPPPSLVADALHFSRASLYRPPFGEHWKAIRTPEAAIHVQKDEHNRVRRHVV